MDRSTREEWAARIARWKDSGLTAAEFASEIGVSLRARRLKIRSPPDRGRPSETELTPSLVRRSTRPRS
jgi:hypothetical protein